MFIVLVNYDSLYLNSVYYILNNVIMILNYYLFIFITAFGSDKQYIIHYLPASNKLLFVAKDNTLRLLSPTTQGVFILGDLLNDGALRISYQEVCHLIIQ